MSFGKVIIKIIIKIKMKKVKKLKDDKLKYIDGLYKNGIANELRKYNVEKKMIQKEIFNEIKKVCLIGNGVELE